MQSLDIVFMEFQKKFHLIWANFAKNAEKESHTFKFSLKSDAWNLKIAY
jgi:hypothetical protein